MAVRAKRTWLDAMAVSASALCLVHCLALPLLVALLPGLLAPVIEAEWVHLALLAFAVPISASALGGGYRVHRSRPVAAAGAAGLALMAWGALAAPSEVAGTSATVAGSLLLAAAHLANWRAQAVRRN